jgi:serine/threonine protein phosphatase PrpC
VEESGCTATVALVTPRHILVAYLGDSPTILFEQRTGTLVGSIEPHWPIPGTKEGSRIIADNGKIEIDKNQIHRVEGQLMLSRAFGDFDLKLKGRTYIEDQTKLGISPEPTVVVWDRREGHQQILVLSTDGLVQMSGDDHKKIETDLKKQVQTQMINGDTTLEEKANAVLDAHMATMPQPYKGDDLCLILVDVSLLVRPHRGGRPMRSSKTKRLRRQRRRSCRRRV